jgi:hypothetical protein
MSCPCPPIFIGDGDLQKYRAGLDRGPSRAVLGRSSWRVGEVASRRNNGTETSSASWMELGESFRDPWRRAALGGAIPNRSAGTSLSSGPKKLGRRFLRPASSGQLPSRVGSGGAAGCFRSSGQPRVNPWWDATSISSSGSSKKCRQACEGLTCLLPHHHGAQPPVVVGC